MINYMPRLDLATTTDPPFRMNLTQLEIWSSPKGSENVLKKAEFPSHVLPNELTYLIIRQLTSQLPRGFSDRIKVSRGPSESPPSWWGGLYVEDGEIDNKHSYICSGHAFQVFSSLLDKINTVNRVCDRRLSEESYKFLMKKMELKADEFESTKDVKTFGSMTRTLDSDMLARIDSHANLESPYS